MRIKKYKRKRGGAGRGNISPISAEVHEKDAEIKRKNLRILQRQREIMNEKKISEEEAKRLAEKEIEQEIKKEEEQKLFDS